MLFHLEEIHDYTAAIIDLEAQGSFQPTKRRLPLWTLEVLDGGEHGEVSRTSTPPQRALFRPLATTIGSESRGRVPERESEAG